MSLLHMKIRSFITEFCTELHQILLLNSHQPFYIRDCAVLRHCCICAKHDLNLDHHDISRHRSHC